MSTVVAMGVAVLISEHSWHHCVTKVPVDVCFHCVSCTLLPSTAAYTCVHLRQVSVCDDFGWYTIIHSNSQHLKSHTPSVF